jgi:alkanesulfonate monooxygenase SsuD/methylene tetrahydromethanopterin reductase-like flavin-dependent oxidoreductase (luciferase family)
MDFGIFNLVNRRDKAQAVPQMLGDTVRQIQAAEQAGFGISWFTEHHFSNYALTPSPLTFAAHVAGVTTRIRLGTAVILGCLYQPARLMGEIAFVDALAGGRLIVGVGSGYQAHELARFGVTLEDSRGMTEELLDILTQSFTQPSVEFHGRHYDLPLTHMSLPQVQAGGPPIWLAGNSPGSIAIAARREYPLIASGFGRDVATLQEVRSGAETVWRAEGKDPATLRFSTLRYCYVTDAKADALAYAENARNQVRQSQYLRRGQTVLPSAFLPEEGFAGEMSPEDLLAWNPIGDAETVAEKLAAEIKAVNPSHVALYMAIGAVPHDNVMRSIEAFGSRVIPLVEKAVGPLSAIGARGGGALTRTSPRGA